MNFIKGFDNKNKKCSLQILGELNNNVQTFGIANFELLKEAGKNFKDPLNDKQDYPLAYAKGGLGESKYEFIQIATINEVNRLARVSGNYYFTTVGDAPSLFLTGGEYIIDGRLPLPYDFDTNGDKPIGDKNCKAQTDYGTNNVYSVPVLNDGESIVLEITGVIIENGTQKNEQRFTCNNGIVIFGEEKIITNCDDGYYSGEDKCNSNWQGNESDGSLYKNNLGETIYPANCKGLLGNGEFKSITGDSPYNGTKFKDGNYYIKPDGNDAFIVYCDMTLDGGGWTRTHIWRYENLNKNYADSIGYNDLVFTSADKIWNNNLKVENGALVIPFKNLDYTSWAWISDNSYDKIKNLDTTAFGKSNGRKKDMDNFISYWYNGNTIGERPDYLLNCGEIVGGTQATIAISDCTKERPDHVRGWRNNNLLGIEILISFKT